MENEPEFAEFGLYLKKGRLARGLTQKELGDRTALGQSLIARLERGDRWPRLTHVRLICRALQLPWQWFLTGSPYPGADLPDVVLELQHFGITDFWVQGARVPGAFRSPEQVVPIVLGEPHPNPRIVEALPVVLAWNRWDPRLMLAHTRVAGRRALQRLGWLADVTVTIHRHTGFPGGCRRARALAWLVRTIPKPQTVDDVGGLAGPAHPSPVWKRWKISYAASLDAFRKRASELSTDRRGRRTEAGR